MSNKKATKASLTTPRVSRVTQDVELDGLGVVTVRGLSRWEMIQVFDLEGKRLRQEQRAVAFGMVDPEMSEEDVAAWQQAGYVQELDVVSQAINRLSGIGKDAPKSVVPEDGERA